MDVAEAWDVTTGDRSVVVAVIDTGIDYRHPDLAAHMWRNPGEVAGDRIDNDGNGYVDDVYGWDFANNDADPFDNQSHGTHVAGTIGAVGNNGVGVAGVAWNVSLMALKFLRADGSGSTSGAIAAINHATRMRQGFGINVVASTNSWGEGGFSTALRDAIAAGGSAGIICVAAAGNDAADNDTTPSYPANYAGDAVISVAATDSSNRLAAFSNYGATSVDIGAPGVGILSTVPNGGYASYSGTSMATPHIAGTVALLAAANPQATAAQISTAIPATAVPIPSLAGKVATGDTWITRAATLVDAGNTVATAAELAITSGAVPLAGLIGDGANAARDVHMFRVVLAAGQTLVVDIDAKTLSGGSNLDSYLSFRAMAAGTYYVGISGYGNAWYSPTIAGSGRNGSTGAYQARFALSAPVTSATGIRIAGSRDIHQPTAITSAFAAYGANWQAALPALAVTSSQPRRARAC